MKCLLKSLGLLLKLIYMSFSHIHKDRIFNPIFPKPWLILQDQIVFTNIVLVVRYLLTLTHPSGSNANIIRFISWLVHHNPTQILFSLLIRYCLSTHNYLSIACNQIIIRYVSFMISSNLFYWTWTDHTSIFIPNVLRRNNIFVRVQSESLGGSR